MIRLLPLLFLFCLACDGGTKSRKAARGENFVPDPNALFFKNTRQRDYRSVDRGDGGNYFTHQDLYGSGAKLIPVIHDDWLDDRAYLQLQTRAAAGPASPAGNITLLISSATGENAVTLKAQPQNKAVAQLQHHLNTNREIRILIGADTLDAFPGDARRYAQETLADYLRLVGHR